ncbi:MAG TPA: hypothetical protein PLP19_07670 [bacterium]|nr:hypothetical protein [bacterium]HPN43350.1 hypothetical protein [bacterium]
MKKRYILFFILALILLMKNMPLTAGEIIVWEDKTPFAKTITEDGVQKDSMITLAPIYNSSGNNVNLDNFTLGGYDWEWPYSSIALGAVEDIDVRSLDGQDLYLITDPQRSVTPGVTGKVFVYNPAEKRITWEYTGSQLVQPVDSYEFFENGQYRILVTDRGNNKVLQIGRETQSIDWEYGKADGSEGSGPNELSIPADAVKIDGAAEVLIADRGNNRVIIVDKAGKTPVWQFGSPSLKSPVDVEYITESASVLITDYADNRVLLVSRATTAITWQYPDPSLAGDPVYGLSSPVDADYLENGHILIADAGHNRIIEVDPADSEFFWELKLTVNGLRDIDQIGSQSTDKDKLLVVKLNDESGKALPARIGFQSGWRESDVFVIERDVNFDSLYWDAEINSGSTTSLELQFRSESDETRLKRAAWRGPTGDTLSTYTVSGAKLPAIHSGHRVYQYRAFLKTDSPKDTPVLKKVTVNYYYYNTNNSITPKPYFWASSIGVAKADSMIPKWKEFHYELKLPQDPLKRSSVQLLFRFIENKSPYRTLYEFTASTEESKNVLNLENIPALWEATSINLNGFPSTLNSSVTPALISWRVVYEKILSTASSIRFVNSVGATANAYLATTPGNQQEGEVMDNVNIILDDSNLEMTRTYYDLPVKSLKSHDDETITLNLKQNYFQNNIGMPIVISASITPGNDTLEVADRDTLIIKYIDTSDSTDVASDSILVVQATTGILTLENAAGAVLKEVLYGQSVFVHITGEQDKNLDPVKQDSLQVVLDNTALDREEVMLYEIAASGSVYNSGNFITRVGIPVTDNKNGVTQDDGILQSSADGSIRATYTDNVILTKSVQVPANPVVNIDLGGEPYIVEVAPNPYNERTASRFSMRVASATGSLVVRWLEIYNIAGELVRKIDGNELMFDTGSTVPVERYGVVENWWDLTNDAGQKVASGTYWLKLYANLTQEDTNQTVQIAIFRKFIVIR